MADDTHTHVVNPLLWKIINFIRRNKGLYNLAKGVRYIKKNGIKQFARTVKARLQIHRPLLEKEIQLNKNERLTEGSFSDDHIVLFKHHKPDYAFTPCARITIANFFIIIT